MKYSIYINQTKMIKRELSLSEACVMNILTQLSTWCDEEVIDWEVYYYLSAGKLVDELPGISESKWTFYNILNKLKEKWIVKHKNHKNKGYYKLTEKGKKWDVVSQNNETKNEGSHKKMSKVSQNNETGLTKWWDNNNTNYNNINNNIYKDLFNHRLEKWITEHRKLRKSMKNKIKSTLKEYDKEEIKEAINTYSKVYHSNKTFFTYKRTLKEFLQRWMDKFLSKQLSDYYKDSYNQNDYKQKESSAKRKKKKKNVEKKKKNVINDSKTVRQILQNKSNKNGI